MIKKLEIKILAENNVEKRELLAEHGLSLYFKYNGKEYLFDTGQGKVLFYNAEKMGINLKDIDTVFLSHGHDDHTGGLKELLQYKPEIRVFAHSEIFREKYKKVGEELEFIGTEVQKSEIENFEDAENIVTAAFGIYNTGTIPAPREDYINPRYIIKKDDKEIVDPFADDISLYIESESGIVILLGCSHKGVENIINEILIEIGDKKIAAIIGGMHLKRVDNEKIKDLINYFSEIDFDLLVPIHCTGRMAAVKFKEAFGKRVQLGSVGDEFEF
jgi:7,8-dihydropterin-6-yl-methyl-4-(beta-D-ribofuranosyl)aminobenzene 5'-phosphate synthase